MNVKKGQIGNALESVAPNHVVAEASAIYDQDKEKYQGQINAEVDAQIFDPDDENPNTLIKRVQDVESLGTISLGPVEAQIATGTDFDDPTAEQRAKVPTVGAMLDGFDPDGAYDVTARNAGSPTFESLDALLSDENLDTLIPEPKRHGGMKIQFVHRSSQKYVQFRLMTQDFSTNEVDWQGIDVSLKAGSRNIAESGAVVENEKDMLIGNVSPQFLWKGGRYIKSDGVFIYYDAATKSVSTIEIIKGNGQNVFVKLGTPASGKFTFYLTKVQSDGTYISQETCNSEDDPYGKEFTLETGSYYRLCFSSTKDAMSVSVMQAAQDDYIFFKFRIDGFLYKGIATPEGTPSVAKDRVFFLATEAGTYTNYGGLTVTTGINVLKYNGVSWSQEQLVEIVDEIKALDSSIPSSKNVGNTTKNIMVGNYVPLFFGWKDGKYVSTGYNPTAAKSVTVKDIIKGNGQSIFVTFGAPNVGYYRFYLTKVQKNGDYISQSYYDSTKYQDGVELTLEKNTYYSLCFTASHDEMDSSIMQNAQGDYINIAFKFADNILSVHMYPEYKNCFEDSLAKYIKSYNLSQQLSTPYVNKKLGEDDKRSNSAGSTFYYNGYVYIWKYQNYKEDRDGPEPMYSYLVKVSVSDPEDFSQVTAFAIDTDPESADYGTGILVFDDQSTLTYIRACSGTIYVDANGINIIQNVQYKDSADNMQYQLVRKMFNFNLEETSCQRCTLAHKGTTYNFNYSDETQGGPLPDDVMSQNSKNADSVFNSGITKDGSTYYGIFAFNANFTHTWILSSTDLINWNTVLNLSVPFSKIGYSAYGEASITPITQDDGKKYLLAIRTFEGPTVLTTINSNFDIVESNIVIKGGHHGSMPSFFKIGDQIYAMICGTDSVAGVHRSHYKIIKVCERSIIDSEVICDTNGKAFGANTILSVDGNNNIFGCITGVNLILCKFTLPTLSNQQCDNILAKILALPD